MGITWIATATDFGGERRGEGSGRGGQVLLGLADRARSHALRAFCRVGAGGQTRCADIVTERGMVPLHFVRAESLPVRVLHQWKDGSREVAVELPGEMKHGPERTGVLSGELLDGWVAAVGLSKKEEQAIFDLMCAGEARDFAGLYGLVRDLGRGER